MNIKFDYRYTTTVATCSLIEDAQTLMQALRFLKYGDIAEAKDCLVTVLECLNDTIQDNTDIPEGGFQPSAQSMICKSVSNGLVLINDKEPVCAGGCIFSECGNDCNPETCPYAWCEAEEERCNPALGMIHHESGKMYMGVANEDEQFFET